MTNQAKDKAQYSIAKLSELLQRSPAQIKAYKRLLLEAYALNTQLVSFANGSLNTDGLGQLKAIKSLYSTGEQHGYCESVWKENPELRPEVVTTNDQVTEEPFTPTAITVIEGNHRETLANIDLNNDFDLGTLRSPLQTVQSYQDPMAMAKQILAQNQERVAAMNADLQRQQAQVNESAQAIAMVEESNFHLMQQTLNYQMEARIQALMLNQNTTQLQQKIAIQQSLGKPSGGHSEQSQA